MSDIKSVFKDRGLAKTYAVDQRLPDRRKKRRQNSADTPHRLKAILAQLKQTAQKLGLNLDFHLDLDLEVITVTVTENNKRRVLRQIDAEEAVRLVHALRSGQQRLLDRLA